MLAQAARAEEWRPPAAVLRLGALRLLLPAAVLAPLTILGLGAWVTWNTTWDQARAEIVHSADAAAEYARSVLDLHAMRAARVNDLLRGLSDAEIRAREPLLHRQLQETLGATSMSPVFRIYVFDRDGRVLVNTDSQPSPPGHLHDRPYFQAVAAPGAPPVAIGETLLGRANGLIFFPVTTRRAGSGNGLPPGSFDGVINVSVSPGRLAEGLARLRGEPNDLLSLVREDGAVLARTLPIAEPPPWRQPPDAEVRRRMAAGDVRFDRVGRSPIDGIARLVAYRRVENWPVYVAAARDSNAVRAQWLERAAVLFGLGLPAVVGLALLARLAQRAHKQAEAARGVLELRVRERTAALGGSEERLRLALEAADLGIWEMDFRDGIAVRSARASEILGYRAEEATTRLGGWRHLLHPEDAPAVSAAFEALRRGKVDRYCTEYRARRPDGSWAWVESRARAVERDAQGRALRIAGTLQDVTARREAEERRVLLMRELDHRAKNALAVVQAALRLTPRTDPAHFATAVEGRIAALARAHTLLAEQRWTGARLHQILEGELAAFLADGKTPGQPRAVLSGPPLQVAATAAQSLSLVFHELATNAVKYGALSVPGGRLRVSWRLEPQAGRLALSWHESGGPAIGAEPARRGFGGRLIGATVRDQLGGTLEQRWLPEGLQVQIGVPLDRVHAGPLEPATLAAD